MVAGPFGERGHKVLIKIVQHVELRRQHAKDLHRLAILVGEGRISIEMQKRVREMIKTFLERARVKLETEESLEQEGLADSPA
jgi:predicted nucleotidyltransferase